MGGKFVLPFRFKRGARTSHILIFVSPFDTEQSVHVFLDQVVGKTSIAM
jgi:hypothetical protein